LPAEPVEGVIEQAQAARAAGARFVVLLHADKPSEALDGRYRPTFARSMKLICRQRLAEVFEASHA
jgi:bifunctional ADP-heptose synthase (sugar kinase/adenylyltransferase)